jgi:putative phosphoribosyl transferase
MSTISHSIPHPTPANYIRVSPEVRILDRILIFETIAGKFHFRFKDRLTAAGILAELLKDKINREEQKSVIILGIPRGGVVIA